MSYKIVPYKRTGLYIVKVGKVTLWEPGTLHYAQLIAHSFINHYKIPGFFNINRLTY